ncbi:MAG: TROVE domain-containing protein [Actinomycetota bacterium]
MSGFLADQFYETGDQRIERLKTLVEQCDPEWLAPFARWLRHVANMRSAPIVVAAEYAANGFPNSRSVISSVLARADEPGELLGYWRAHHSRAVRSSVKRGINDAITGANGSRPLYSEFTALRYDSGPWRFGDVIEVTHPQPNTPEQSTLFKWLLDRRRHGNETPPAELQMITAVRGFDATPEEQRRDLIRTTGLPKGVSWERLAGWLPGGMDREAWEAVLPQMGYMAVLRNLNNFDRAGIDPVIVRPRLTDPEAIEKSRVLPFRFLTAYANAETDNYRLDLAASADIAISNLPQLAGRTLVMVDCSGSMGYAVGAGRSRNPLSLSQLAGFTAESLARSCEDALIVCYDVDILNAAPPARHVPVVRAAADDRYFPRGGTHTWRCTSRALSQWDADRVVIITDEQAHDTDPGIRKPIVTWNLAGYRPHHAPHGTANRFLIGGVTDRAMQLLPTLINASGTGDWPWHS